MNLNDINGGVVASHKQDSLLLSKPKKQEPVLNKIDKKEESVEKKQFNDYYTDIRKEVKDLKSGATTTTTTSSSYGSYNSNRYGTS